jgi:hypothetical protein
MMLVLMVLFICLFSLSKSFFFLFLLKGMQKKRNGSGGGGQELGTKAGVGGQRCPKKTKAENNPTSTGHAKVRMNMICLSLS